MKKVFVLAIGAVSLMAMSFTLPKTSKFEIVETANGAYLTNVEMLSLEDMKALQAATITGAAETSVFHQSFVRSKGTKENTVVNETVTKNKDVKELELLNAAGEATLASILAKYN